MSIKSKKFQLTSNFKPAGDQPEAIEQLIQGLNDGLQHQTLLGVTGSGKTFTIANVIAKLNRPAMILAPNKTLAAQLYAEMKAFFPHNAVEYFVSYYDYYQPEAYVPSSDTFIEKDASINEQIEQMRLSATKSFLERSDTIVIASVSAIYGLGDVNSYKEMMLHLQVGDLISHGEILKRLAQLQYTRNEASFHRATFRVRGDIIDIFPAEENAIALRVELFDDEIEKLKLFDPLTGKTISELQSFTVNPKNHYVTPKEILDKAIHSIKLELKERRDELLANNRLIEEQRLTQRTLFDIEMINELGYCSGIENYSRYLSGRAENSAPPTLFDYMPSDTILFIDESHITIGQINGMFKGDRSRKQNLVDYGFRLPSALDNRPLKFEEFEALAPQTIYVSATPGDYELEKSNSVIDQVVRPTGLLDPILEIRPVDTQVDDLLSEIKIREKLDERVLVTTETKRMAEDLSDYLDKHGVRVRYLHSDIDTVERVEIIRDLRLGKFDVLVGVNLLREGLDMPEVSLVAILNADKGGMFRSKRSLIQMIGRAARNLKGKAIFYADKITPAMQEAIDETERRRTKQEIHNKKLGIEPKALNKKVSDLLDVGYSKESKPSIVEFTQQITDKTQLEKTIKQLEKQMQSYAKNLEFEQAGLIRDQVKILKLQLLELQ